VTYPKPWKEQAGNKGNDSELALNYGRKAEIGDALNDHSGATNGKGISGSNHRKNNFHSTSIPGGLPDPRFAEFARVRNARKQFSAVADRLRGEYLLSPKPLWPDFNRAR